jgi:hypothetical protein
MAGCPFPGRSQYAGLRRPERDGTGRGPVFGTLLGPEATGPPAARGSLRGSRCGAGRFVSRFPGMPKAAAVETRRRRGVTGLLFENCIVDASIL